MKRSFALLSLIVLLPARMTWAAEGDPPKAVSTPNDASGAPDSVADAPSEPEITDDETPSDEKDEAAPAEGMEIDWKGPLKLFDMGQVDQALDSLRSQVVECGEPEEQKCTEPQFATLYGSLGVVMAGSGDHQGGVVAFRRALTFTDVRLRPEYRTPQIEKALAEARGESPAPAPAPAPAPQAAPATTASPLPQTTKPIQGKAFFMLSGQAQAGLASDGVNSVGLLRFAGGVTTASRTGEGTFAMGLRGNGGVLVGNAALGSFGGTVVLGGMGIPEYRNRFGFILGGLGIEHFPAVSTSMVAMDFLMGRAAGGGAVALSVHSGFNAAEYFGTVGIELGFGGLSSGR